MKQYRENKEIHAFQWTGDVKPLEEMQAKIDSSGLLYLSLTLSVSEGNLVCDEEDGLMVQKSEIPKGFWFVFIPSSFGQITYKLSDKEFKEEYAEL